MREPHGRMAQRLRYALALLLYTGIVLSLYDVVGEGLKADTRDAGGLAALLGASVADWLVGLAPVAMLLVLMGVVVSGRRLARVVWLSVAVVIAAATGVILQDLLFHGGDVAWLLANPRDVLADTIGVGLPAGLLTAVYEFHLRSVDATEAAFRVQADRIAMEAEMSKARVHLLRAQIEPHFIFNSLAHVRRLFQVDSATGHKMLSSLIRYFGSALPSLRQQTCSLAQEAALIDAYLDIHRLRMGPRLGYEVAFPESLLELQVPSMLLLTLVENAIKHGLSPVLEGGFVRVSAHASGNFLELRVADSGCGMTASSGTGTGLANIRARLGSLYGTAASLTLSNNEPRGITAAVRVPLHSATP